MSALLQHHLRTGRLESGVRLAIRQLGADPLREEGHRPLMRLYARLDRPAEALRQFRRCRRLLSRELGVAPEPETDRLFREIAKGRSDTGQSPGTAKTPRGAPVPASSAGNRSPGRLAVSVVKEK